MNKSFGDAMTSIMPLAAIWMLDKPILKGNGERSVRVIAGDRLKVEKGAIVDCEDGEATHIVEGCYGNVASSTLYFTLRDITSGNKMDLYVNGVPPEANNEQ